MCTPETAFGTLDAPLETRISELAASLLGDKPARYDRSQGPWNPLYPTLGFAFGQSFDISPLRLACLRPSLRQGFGAACKQDYLKSSIRIR